MSQTKEGAIKTGITNKKKYGADYYAKIGAIGGKKKNPNKGFGSKTPEERREAGRLGGTRSVRGAKRIYLSGKKADGAYALVDSDDYDRISAMGTWHLSTSGYATRKDANGNVRMHRLINNTPDGLETDHINHNKLDNRKVNLRSVTKSENLKNASVERWGVSEINANKTHCKNGHEFTADNTKRYKNERGCRTCINENQNKRRAESRRPSKAIKFEKTGDTERVYDTSNLGLDSNSVSNSGGVLRRAFNNLVRR